MNYLQLCQTVRQECGIQGETPSAVASQRGTLKRIVEWVRDADNLIQLLHPDWNFLYSNFAADTIEGIDTISKPDDLGEWDVDSFAVGRGTSDGRGLSVIDFREWQQNNNLKVNSEPSTVTIGKNYDLLLAQPPDGVYSISAGYWKAPTLLAANTDISPIPLQFHRIIIVRAKMFFFEDQEGFDNYKLANMEYEQWLVHLRSYSLPGQQHFSQIQPSLAAVRVL